MGLPLELGIGERIGAVCDSNFQYVLIMGDFNYPHINWCSAHSFLMCVQGCFLYQHVTEPTHFRHGQAAKILDLVFTTGEKIVTVTVH